jgi:hypothetical protein
MQKFPYVDHCISSEPYLPSSHCMEFYLLFSARCTGPPFAPIFLQMYYQSTYSFAPSAHILFIHSLPKIRVSMQLRTWLAVIDKSTNHNRLSGY